ncbi:DUF3466 family protein [Psychromonas hadalis]|uniref:DUF3466 family protein n=1 Tax=Psychromonas hadalis TaxID=211669 RepID=UPI0003B4A6F2|nr:DUF3466 family protein [Psychromonas hadalis]
MKFKVTVASLALLMANSVYAQNLPYYTVEEIGVTADGALYGPFPVAMATSEDEALIATYSMKASLSTNIDIGLPFTFNRECQYDDELCELEFEGSETAGQHSYENAYQAWRNAQSYVAKYGHRYTSYMFGNVGDTSIQPFDSGEGNTDVKVTDVYISDSEEKFVIGYSSAPYNTGKRDFVRRAFIQSLDGSLVTQLLPTPFTADNGKYNDNGGFSSAYKITKLKNGKVLVIGHASVSYPRDNVDYFNDCYKSDEDDERYNINELVRCPGFDTQAWTWDVTDIVNGNTSDKELTGTALASNWLDNRGGNATFSANAFDINRTGIAVGASTFEFHNNDEGARQRAIIMPLVNGKYGEPVEIKAVTNDIEDQEDWIYNTWALTISEAGIITGNREYEAAKGRNKATEFFVYNNKTGAISFPLKDKKVATKKQSLESGSQTISKSGANSRVYAANKDNWMVGAVDDFDQVDPVYYGSPRSQTAFLFDNSTNQAWLMNDLICKRIDGVVVQDELIRIRSARVISDSGVVLAEGFRYPNAEDYKIKINGKQVAFKLTPNPAVSSPNDSPNCWESSLLKSNEEPYERQGGATLWLWIFALPLLFIRRFKR